MELFELWNPKSTSFLTRCHVWEASVHNQFKHGKGGILETRYLKELDRTDGEQNFRGFTTLRILSEIQKMMAELKCELEQFQGRIIFMSMFTVSKKTSSCPCKMTLYGKKGNEHNCMANSLNVATHATRFPLGCWSVWGPGCEKVVWGSRPKAKWWMEQSQITLKVKSVSLWWYRLRVPTRTPILKDQNQHRETCCNIISRNSQKFLKIRKLSKLCKDAGFLKKIEKRQSFITIEEGSEKYADSMSRILSTSKPHNIPTEMVDAFKYEVRPSFGFETLSSRRTLLIDIVIESLLKTEQFHGFALWMVSTNTSQKRQRKYPLRILTRQHREAFGKG